MLGRNNVATCNGLTILLVALCYLNRDKVRQLWATRLVKENTGPLLWQCNLLCYNWNVVVRPPDLHGPASRRIGSCEWSGRLLDASSPVSELSLASSSLLSGYSRFSEPFAKTFSLCSSAVRTKRISYHRTRFQLCREYSAENYGGPGYRFHRHEDFFWLF